MKSTFTRLFLSMALILLVSFLLLGSLFFSYYAQYIVTEKHSALSTTAREVAHTTMAYSAAGEAAESWDFRMSIDSIARASDCTILVCARDGSIEMCSGQDIKRTMLGAKVGEVPVERTLNDGEYFGRGNAGEIFKDDVYMVGVPLHDAGGRTVTGLIFVAAANDTMASRVTLLTGFIFIAIIVFVVAFFITTYISMRQTRPIDEIAAAANSFANGHLDSRVKTAALRKDEIGRLAVSFNAMAESLEQSEKRRQEFVSNVSHELKTPMTTIGGFVDGILDGTIPREKERQYLLTISDEVKRLSRLVRMLLETSRLQDKVEKQPWSPFDISDVAVRTMLTFEQSIEEKQLEVDVDVPEGPVMVIGSSDSINQVLYNLIENAVKFSNPGGRLGVKIRHKGGKVITTVSNTGETIPPEQQKLIFDRFHKTDASRSLDKDGVGLGLYIVRTIILKHGEDITVASNDGLTEFTFTMTPASKKQASGGNNGLQHQQR